MMFLVPLVLVPKLIPLLWYWRNRNVFTCFISPRFSPIVSFEWIDINVCHFLIHLIKTTSYNTYPNLPSAPPEAPQVAYHLKVVQAKRRGLIAKEQMFKQKYEKYTKILNQLTWLNACSSGISVATGISSVATFTTFIGLPVSISLGAASLTGAIASGIISALTKKYQKKLKQVTKLIDIVTPALVLFERVVSGTLKNGIIDEEEFNMLQTLHLETLNELTSINHRMEAEHRSLVKKSPLEKINNIKKNTGTKA